jgi:YD repeat-containing protein
MKKLGICILLAALACSLPLLSGRDKGTVKYFRHLRIYKIHDLTFTYPVDPKDYKKINCYKVEYDEDGRIISAVYLINGERAFDSWNALSSIEIKYFNSIEKRKYKDLNGKSIDEYVDYEIYEFDSTGMLLSCTNYSKFDEITEDSTGIAKYLYSTDSLKNVLRAVCLNIDGDTILTTLGYYRVVFKYDNFGNMIEMANYGKNGRLLPIYDGVAINRYKYDENGNRTELSVYNEQNERVISSRLLASKYIYKYDKNGNLLYQEVLDEHNNLHYDENLGYAFYNIEYDKLGNGIKIEYYDINGNPTIISKFGKSGKIVEDIIFSNLTRLKGFENEEYDYYIVKDDKGGNPIEYCFYYANGDNYETTNGYACIVYKYDENDNIIENSFYSADGKLTEDNTTGIAVYKYKYDKNNFKIEVAKYGVDGKLKNAIDNGVAKFVSLYDDNGIPQRISFWGANCKLKAPKGQNWAQQEYYYDDIGRPTGFSFLGVENKLALNDEFGCALVMIEYDGENYSERNSFYDQFGDLVVSKTAGCAIREVDRDFYRNIIEERLFDADSNLISKSTR